MGLHRNKILNSSRILKGERRFMKFQATLSKRRRLPDVIQPDEDTCDSSDYFLQNGLEKPVQRNAANARERARMQVLSKAFCRLKTCLPWVPPDTKLSKLDTLKLAATYIAYLMKILGESRGDENAQVTSLSPREGATHPVALTWPFTINSRSTYSDYTSPPPVQGNCAVSADYSNNDSTDYRNLAPCEYLAMSNSNCHRRNNHGHYIQQ